jgi:hypothetical protein
MDTSCKQLIAPGFLDSWLKVQLVLLFYRHPHWCGDTQAVSEWLHESPWQIKEALDDLVSAGLLNRINQSGHALYHLEPNFEWWAMLVQFIHCYDDPLRREDIYASVRAADREQKFRALALGAGMAISIGSWEL